MEKPSGKHSPQGEIETNISLLSG